ncbi:MAG: hypothetical protein IT381_18080 [Deltaproteobacteria bacterium]|nr:hypothetical protein [Deltaproteobacteria bacterium]
MTVRFAALPLLALFLLACPGGAGGPKKKYTQECATDDQCESNRCLQGKDDKLYCTRTCALDLDCANDDALYCCERIGEDASYCTKPASGACRQAELGAGCQGEGDPFCARSQLFCGDAGGRQVCTRECLSAADCADVRGSKCDVIANGVTACIPPDINNLPRLTSNCAGDRDCNAGNDELCQFMLDNADVDPRTFVTVCSSSQKYGPGAAYSACNADIKCDRFFCLDDLCAATCANDSHCKPGFVCEPRLLPVPTVEGNDSGNRTLVGFCAKQRGSYRPCDSAASSCPTDESCQVARHFDGGSIAVCRALPKVVSTTPPVATTYAKSDEVCSYPVDEDGDSRTPATWKSLVGGEIKLCESGMCEVPGYCSALCKADTDCVAGPGAPMAPASDLVCAYEPFRTHCERALTEGKAIGAACSAASVRDADLSCASTFCDQGACAARKADGGTCDRAAACRSFACIAGKCGKPCRGDSECTGGAVARVCETLPQTFDTAGTPTVDVDDAVDLPSFCMDLPGYAGVSCPDNPCPGGTICRPIGAADGSYRGVCATPNAGAAVGESCTASTGCQTKLCLFDNDGNGRCAGPCLDNSDCSGATQCIPITTTGTAASQLCLVPTGMVAAGAACTTAGQCRSNLCVDGVCVDPCPRAVALGADCGDGKLCTRVEVGLSPRLTYDDAFDDALDYVNACVAGATLFAGDPAACAAPKQFVFRPTDAGALVGACLKPLIETRAEGQDCQDASECQTGLCVDHVCTKACAAAPADSCGAAASRCDVAARAQLGQNHGLTATVAACRKKCGVAGDAACAASDVCEADPGGGAPRFCRQKCVADKDCGGAQTCNGTHCI